MTTSQSKGAWPFAKVRRFIHGLNLDSADQFRLLVQQREREQELVLPPEIPAHPEQTFARQFLGWADFLGLHLRPIMPFAQAQQLTVRMGFSSLQQWRAYFRGRLRDAMPHPRGLTAFPHLDYPHQFEGYSAWFRANRPQFCGIREAREFVHSLGLETEDDWWAYVLGLRQDLPPLPEAIPWMPALVYERYWTGFDRFLMARRQYRSFEAARDFVRQLGLCSVGEWRDYAQGNHPLSPKPEDIPSRPDQVYEEFRSYGDWLFPAGQRWLPFEAARQLVSQYGFRSMAEFEAWRDGQRPDLPPPPDDLPRSPASVYARHWKGAGDFLNDGKPRYRSLEEARRFLRPLGLKSVKDWNDYCDGKRPDLPPKPADIPRNPCKVYFYEYEGIHDFLGVYLC